MNEVIKKLQEWQLEANSGHNDGWTQKHYRDKINEVVGYLVQNQFGNKLEELED